jgi:hypothetical protein
MMANSLGTWTWILFKREWVVLEMASRKGVLRLVARVSRVCAVTAKHIVMLFSRTWVALNWGGILVVWWLSGGSMIYAILYTGRYRKSQFDWLESIFLDAVDMIQFELSWFSKFSFPQWPCALIWLTLGLGTSVHLHLCFHCSVILEFFIISFPILKRNMCSSCCLAVDNYSSQCVEWQ